MIHVMKRTVWTVAILASLAGQAVAQDTSSIIGTARDQTGAALPGATVTVADAARGVTQTGQSGSQGSFFFPLASAKRYITGGALLSPSGDRIYAAGYKGIVVVNTAEVHGMMGEPASAMKVGDTCLTIVYPNSDGVRWDVEYYKAHHMPLIMSLYGKDAIKRFELRKGATGQTGGPPPYIGSVNIYINDQKAFDAAGKQHGPTLVADVPHFSSVMPIAFPTIIHGVG